MPKRTASSSSSVNPKLRATMANRCRTYSKPSIDPSFTKKASTSPTQFSKPSSHRPPKHRKIVSETNSMKNTFLLPLLAVAASVSAADLQFRDQELQTKLTVGYAVRLIDMNDDRRLDIAIVDSGRILWLENPNWTEHVILQGETEKDNVCFAPYDIDRDGRLDFAVGAAWQPGSADATKIGGTIQWITGGSNPLGQWKLYPIDKY